MTTESDSLNYCRDQLRAQDRERFLASLFMPERLREAYWILGAFNIEIARIAETVREPIAGAIRLKWWDEVLDQIAAGDTVRRHPVAQALATLCTGRMDVIVALKPQLEARETDLLPGSWFQDFAALDAYATQTGGNLLRALAMLGDNRMDDAVLQTGQCWTLLSLLQATVSLWRKGKSPVPVAMLAAHGISEEQLLDGALSTDTVLHLMTTQIERLRQTVDRIPPSTDNRQILQPHVTILRHRIGVLKRSPAKSLQLRDHPISVWLLMKLIFRI